MSARRQRPPGHGLGKFALATREKFFLCIEATDPQFDRVETRRFLESLEPLSVAEVSVMPCCYPSVAAPLLTHRPSAVRSMRRCSTRCSRYARTAPTAASRSSAASASP